MRQAVRCISLNMASHPDSSPIQPFLEGECEAVFRRLVVEPFRRARS